MNERQRRVIKAAIEWKQASDGLHTVDDLDAGLNAMDAADDALGEAVAALQDSDHDQR